MTLRQKLYWAWTRAFELAIILGGFSAFFLVALGGVWLTDNKPLFVENPNPYAHFVVNPIVHAGDLLDTVRSVRRTDDCPLDAGAWIATANGDIVMPIQTYVSFSDPSTEFRKQRIWFIVPKQVPPGHYLFRLFVTCQKNPLMQVGQRMRPDLPFEVIPPESKIP